MRARRCVGAAALASLLVPAAGSAHPQYALSTINRYSKLALLPRGQVRLIYTIMVGDAPAYELRRKADQDGDGRLSAAEGAAMAATLLAGTKEGLSLEVDGRPVAPPFSEPTLGLAGAAVAPSAFSVDASAVLSVPAGAPHTLRYEDRLQLPPMGEIEILVEEGPGVRLTEACQGSPRPEHPERLTSFRFYGPPQSSLTDRSVTLRFLEAQPVLRASSRGWLAACAAPLVLAAVWLARRQRSRPRVT